ncbi:MAG: glycosyltransferase family protein [Sedimentitalea sp.]
MRVMIVVTHLLGTGHLARATAIARAFVNAGHDVRLVTGGAPVPWMVDPAVPMMQLPPLRSDGTNFTQLLDDQDQIADPDYLARRAAQLCTITGKFAPQILITELFPFGRRVLRNEFIALLETASAGNAVILASVRDILAPPSKPARAQQSETLVEIYYDGVLVHSDPSVTRLEDSWPVSKWLKSRLIYTGFVTPAATTPPSNALARGDIVVSAGGGDVGTALFEAAIEASEASRDLNWRVLVGGQDANARIQTLPNNSPALIEPVRPDFRSLLSQAGASVSLCGYNTALDVLQAGVPAVFAPFEEGGEVEQTLRARSLSALPGIAVLPTSDLNPEHLLETVRAVIAAPARAPRQTGFDGAVQTVAKAVALAAGAA